MKLGYNELVGLQATLSRIVPRYSLTHHYRWIENGKTAETGTLRGYDMHRHIPSDEILRTLGDAYAPAIQSIWRKVTPGCIEQYFQFETGAGPKDIGLEGAWHMWAQW